MFLSGKYKEIGEEFVLRDLSTGSERIVHRHIARGNDQCLVYSFNWLNDRTVVFSTSIGIHALDVPSGSVRMLAPAGLPSSSRPLPPTSIIGLNDDYLFTTRTSIVHVKTGKETSVPALRLGNGSAQFAIPQRN